jgi:hypothetical protein
MVAHVVLFRPKPELTTDDRRAFVAAMQHALTSIPAIRRARVGRRLTLGRQYDALNQQEFPYAAILEFANQEDLQTYLEHPAHEMLGAQFYTTSQAAMVFDFDLLEGDDIRDLLL